MPDSDLQQLIHERIQQEGPISFAEYMRMALYEPGYGYYMTGAAKMGWEADYFTSTDVSSLFANCMGRQLFTMWEKLRSPGHFVVLEQGAGRGHLAEGVRTWAQKEAPEFCEVLDYRIEDIGRGEDATVSVEFDQSKTVRYSTQDKASNISSSFPIQGEAADIAARYPSQGEAADIAARYPTQGEAANIAARYPAQGDPRVPTPHNTTPAPTRGASSWDWEMPSVVLSNELIDAFPVHIVEKRDEGLYEVFVDVKEEGRLCEVLDKPSTVEVDGYLDRYKIPWRTFEEGWRAEINLDALRWLQRTAGLMRHGFILTIDYGDKAKALYTAWRKRGTLLCYYKHQENERPLLHPGEQDITAHVNFSALIDEGRRLGMRLHRFTTQRLWLHGFGIQEELEQRYVNEFAEAETARASDRGQVALLKWRDLRQRASVLTDPDGMGNFKVMILRR
jgi:SAM-dependent MidA family methyltransferase